MSSAEQQPLKKRKLYDYQNLPSESVATPPTLQPVPQPAEAKPRDDESVARPPTPPLSQDDLLRRRRNQEEIRSAYANYKTIKRCASSRAPLFIPELERAYLALITASRGCTSVQRIVSECIPRYASYCPTALEAATQVIINMHNWSLPHVSSKEDMDEVSYEISNNCIGGLVDICRIASSEASTSSVVQGICSAVFHCVLAFFASMLEGSDIFQIIDKEGLKMLHSPELYPELKHKVSSEDGPLSLKLSKLRALSFLHIIFCCLKSLLTACLDLFNTPETEGFSKHGKYLLDQLVKRIDPDRESHLDVTSGTEKTSAGCVGVNSESNDGSNKRVMTLSNCLLGLVLKKDPPLKRWIYSRYKKLSMSASPRAASEFRDVLEGFLKSFDELIEPGDIECDEDDAKVSNSVIRQHLTPRSHNILRYSSEVSGEYHSNYIKSMDLKGKGRDECAYYGMSSMSWDNPNNQFSPISRKPVFDRNTSFESSEEVAQVEKIQASNATCSIAMNHIHTASPYRKNEIMWYADGDPAAMDVISASRQLWLGCFPPETSESSIRYQLERYGPIDSFYFHAAKGFTLVEYRSIIDAVKAREYMYDHFPRDGRFRIKFMDAGLGSRGAIDDVAVGSSCHVFIGNVLSHRMKDDILCETMKVVYRGPRMVTELAGQSALLLEYDCPEEATRVMTCLRQYCRGSNHFRVHRTASLDMVRSHQNYPSNMGTPAIHGSPRSWSTTESHAGNRATTPLASGLDSSREFVSPGCWPPSCGIGTHDSGTTSYDGYRNSAMGVGISQGGPASSDAMWMYRKPEFEHQSTPGTSCVTVPTPGPTTSASQVPAPIYTQPIYYPPTSSWDPRCSNIHNPSSQVHLNVMPNSVVGSVPPPYLPVSITPLSQMTGSGFPQYNQMVSQPQVAPLPSAPPPNPEMPPLPPSPPPVPPPPSSPPPPPPPETEPSGVDSCGSTLPIQWQGMLSKSGVRYCTVYARRLGSDICNYSAAVREPLEWPIKLDMTKRTDFRHIKSTFSNSPPHKREVCQLLPSAPVDHKGFQDFMSYLKQRDCAGVIKIPAVKHIWARLLFILPYSSEACSMLGVTSDTPDCLIALILPKESNLE